MDDKNFLYYCEQKENYRPSFVNIALSCECEFIVTRKVRGFNYRKKKEREKWNEEFLVCYEREITMKKGAVLE